MKKDKSIHETISDHWFEVGLPRLGFVMGVSLFFFLLVETFVKGHDRWIYWMDISILFMGWSGFFVFLLEGIFVLTKMKSK